MDEPSSVERPWEEFQLKASAAARERLLLHYAPLVKYVAGRVSVGLPPNIEQADLVAYGIFGLIDAIEKSLDKGAEDPVAVFESQEMKGILAGAINRLGEREKIVITLYYEGLTLAEIGQVLGVTESRVCQMRTKAVLQLRAKLQDAR